MNLRVHQIEVAAMRLPRLFPAFPIHPATMATWIAPGQLVRILWNVMKMSRDGEPTFVWLIEGADVGPILVDTGIPSVEIADAWYSPGVRWTMSPDQRLEKILPARTGVRIEDVKLVINTHIHFDHSGGNGLFPGRKIIVQRKDLDVGRKHEKGMFGTHPFDVGYHTHSVGDADYDARDGDFDVCPGVRVVATPGHTPGSQTVIVDTKDGAVGLAGDLFYSSFSMPDKMLGEKGFARLGLKPCRINGKLIYEPHGHARKRIEEKRMAESELFGYYLSPVFDSVEDLQRSMSKIDKACKIILTTHNGFNRGIHTIG